MTSEQIPTPRFRPGQRFVYTEAYTKARYSGRIVKYWGYESGHHWCVELDDLDPFFGRKDIVVLEDWLASADELEVTHER